MAREEPACATDESDAQIVHAASWLYDELRLARVYYSGFQPVPGTPLYAEHEADGSLLDAREYAICDAHGQLSFNYRHPHIHNGAEAEFLIESADLP